MFRVIVENPNGAIAVPQPQRFVLVVRFAMRPLDLQHCRGSVAPCGRKDNRDERVLIRRLYGEPEFRAALADNSRQPLEPVARGVVVLHPRDTARRV